MFYLTKSSLLFIHACNKTRMGRGKNISLVLMGEWLSKSYTTHICTHSKTKIYKFQQYSAAVCIHRIYIPSELIHRSSRSPQRLASAYWLPGPAAPGSPTLSALLLSSTQPPPGLLGRLRRGSPWSLTTSIVGVLRLTQPLPKHPRGRLGENVCVEVWQCRFKIFGHVVCCIVLLLVICRYSIFVLIKNHVKYLYCVYFHHWLCKMFY